MDYGKMPGTVNHWTWIRKKESEREKELGVFSASSGFEISNLAVWGQAPKSIIYNTKAWLGARVQGKRSRQVTSEHPTACDTLGLL